MKLGDMPRMSNCLRWADDRSLIHRNRLPSNSGAQDATLHTARLTIHWSDVFGSYSKFIKMFHHLFYIQFISKYIITINYA